MTAPVIDTPRGSILVNTASMKAELKWNPGFVSGAGGNWQGKYSNAQKFVDSEILRLSEPYTPLQTGMLVMSGTLGTDVGSGTVSWIVPYAKSQYYGGRKEGASETGKLRGRYWFERMKEVRGSEIIAGAKKIAGGG